MNKLTLVAIIAVAVLSGCSRVALQTELGDAPKEVRNAEGLWIYDETLYDVTRSPDGLGYIAVGRKRSPTYHITVREFEGFQIINVTNMTGGEIVAAKFRQLNGEVVLGYALNQSTFQASVLNEEIEGIAGDGDVLLTDTKLNIETFIKENLVSAFETDEALFAYRLTEEPTVSSGAKLHFISAETTAGMTPAEAVNVEMMAKEVRDLNERLAKAERVNEILKETVISFTEDE